MGRVIRRVPKDWEHPKNEHGHEIPLHETFPYNQEEIEEGLRDGWLEGEPPFYDVGVMPQWDEAERTHYQMYENVTEGTPISPVMNSPEILARWLADNKASASGEMTATYEQWLSVCKGGWAPTLVYTPERGLISGVEAFVDNKKGER